MVSYPLGKDAAGYIMYNQDGYMSVAIMGPERTMFAAGDLLSWSAQERAQAAGTTCLIAAATSSGERR